MKTITEIKKEREQKHTMLFNSVGLFWAFSEEQFATNKTFLKEGDKYISIGNGGYLPKSNIDTFTNGIEIITNWYNKEIKANKKLIESTILYELNNYECFYTGNIDAAFDVLKDNFNKKQIWTVWNKFKEQYQETL